MAVAAHFRAHARWGVELPAELRQGETLHGARVVDLGLGGAGLLVSAQLSLEHLVVLRVETPNLWDPLELVAWPRWAYGTGPAFRIGVAFDHRDARALRSLAELLALESQP
jgi:hypothetical protein